MRCPDDGYMVGVDGDVPDDPTDFYVERLPIVGCNRLRCSGGDF